MKILQISYIFPPHLTIGDGLTNVVHNISHELVRQGHEVTVFTSNSLDLFGSRRIRTKHPISVNGVTVHYLDYFMKYRTFFITPRIYSLLDSTISSFDIVHIQDPRSFQGVIAAHFAQKYGVPYVWQPHGSFSLSEPQTLFPRIMRRILDFVNRDMYLHSNRIITSNKTESEFFSKILGISSDRISILPNGINLSKYQHFPRNQFRAKFSLHNKHIILYMGRLHRSKGISLLIQAFAQLSQISKENVVLVLAGPDDGFQQEAESLIQSLGISNQVIIPGFLDHGMKLAALADASVFVTPSFTGFPITFLEACSMGLPIVTTSFGDELDWINEKVGFVVAPDPTSIARAMNNIISSDTLYDKFSSNAKQIVKDQFSIEHVVTNLIEIYRDIIANS